MTLVNGDVLGARATADGQLQVYRNGALLGTRNIAAWPFASSSGYIGLWVANAPNAFLDGFGGGNATP